jgi:hypothetical protein
METIGQIRRRRVGVDQLLALTLEVAVPALQRGNSNLGRVPLPVAGLAHRPFLDRP